MRTGEAAGGAQSGAAGAQQAPAAWTIFEGLFTTGFVDGLVRRLDRVWPQLARDQVEDAVADALVALYDAVADGRVVRRPEAYVFKAAQNGAKGRFDSQAGQVEYDDLLHADPEEHGSSSAGYADLRAEALRIARQLLPRLGQTNIQRVMAIVFEAIEADVSDISPSDIAAALGLSSAVVRQSLHRGFQRLERLAREEGLQLALDAVLDEDAPLLDNQEVDDDDDE